MRVVILQRPDTLTEAIVKYVRDAIVRGEFAPGSQLPEVALARQLDTSRGTVREALRALSDGGLVEIIPHRGVFVTRLTPAATWEISSLRALLEPYGARLALEGHAADLTYHASVEAAFERLREAVASGDPVEIAEADVSFHGAVFAPCGHKMLLAELEKLQVLSRRLVLTSQMYAADAGLEMRQHAPIREAVKSRDPAVLEAVVRTHVIEAGEILLARMAAPDPAGSTDREPDVGPFGSWPTGVELAAIHPPRAASLG